MATDTEGKQQTARPRRTAPPRQNAQREPRRAFGAPPPRRRCAFCGGQAQKIDYKRVDMLQNYVTERGKIAPRRSTGLCAKHQRHLTLAVKRARHLALLPFTAEHVRRG